jgi:hypothetical protein
LEWNARDAERECGSGDYSTTNAINVGGKKKMKTWERTIRDQIIENIENSPYALTNEEIIDALLDVVKEYNKAEGRRLKVKKK